jgi:hypothetical protein
VPLLDGEKEIRNLAAEQFVQGSLYQLDYIDYIITPLYMGVLPL